MFRYIFTIIYIIIAAIFDKRTKKIPNFLNIIGVVGSLVFNIFLYPIPINDWVVRIIILIIIFFLGMKRWLGGGDIKMWMTLDLLIGAVFSSLAIAAGSLLLILFSLITNFKENMPIAFISFNNLMMTKKLETEIKSKKGYPLAVFVSIPIVIYCFYKIIVG